MRPGVVDEDLARTRGVWIGLMFAFAATLTPLTLLVPHGPDYNIRGILAITAVAATISIWLLTRGTRLSLGRAHAVVATAAVLTSAVIYFTGGLPNAGTLFFVWIVLFSFYFFEPRAASAQLALVLLLYAVNAALTDSPYSLVANAIATAGALIGAAAIIGALRRRIDKLLEVLEQTARTDGLTGLPNRRALDEELERHVARVARSADPLSLLLLDLDHFKVINDRFGHQAGDRVLEQTASVLRGCLRKGDLAARYGGEEFAVVLPTADALRAGDVAERIRVAVAGQPVEPDLAITVSIGIATAIDGDGSSDLVGRADYALYEAKESGRNRVVGTNASARAHVLS